MKPLRFYVVSSLLLITLTIPGMVLGQGVTTASINGLVTDEKGESLTGANIVVVHEPSGTQYGAVVRIGGLFDLLNLRVGGPYTVTASFIGYQTRKEENVFVSLGQTVRLDFRLIEEAIEMEMIQVVAEQDEVLNSGRTGAATYVSPDQVAQLPSIKRSTRDITRLDPRSDGNFSFGGRNWLYNNISLDGSYFNNPFGLDDPAVGGQTNAEPVPYDAIEQVQVSIAPFDVREGGFIGAGINSVTKSGTNRFRGSIYSFFRNESLMGNKVGGEDVIANPDLSFNQSGFTLSGPIIQNKLFFFINAELERRDDPGTNFVADKGGNVEFGESRVEASVMDEISQIMNDVYDYDTGPYEGFIHETDNNKLLLKLDWNINVNHNLTFRYNMLDAVRALPPHGFVLSFNNTGRGPNSSSLPFQNSGYKINNELNSYALEINSTFGSKVANRLFFSYNRFRDFRDPFSRDFPTIEIGEAGVTYTTVGHEPFSIHNILDQDVIQVTNNLSYFMGKHVLTAGFNYERFKFFNSFNIFRHGLFMVAGDLDYLFPGAGFLDFLGATTFSSLDNFFARTDEDSADFYDFNALADWNVGGSGPYKGEEIDVAQLSVYGQDEFWLSDNVKVTAGLRIDIPQYNTEPVDNPFSRELTLLDENDESETVDQSKLPDASPLYSPRAGFNWDVNGDRSFQIRGGTGVFTGRLPFVWVGNVISNPGVNLNLYPTISEDEALDDHLTDDGDGRQGGLEGTKSVLQQSFDLNGIDADFNWPQVWTTNLAVDKQLPGNMLGTLELLYGKDINAIYMRNADMIKPDRTLKDGRPYFTDGDGVFELNPDGGAGVYVLDNTDEGYNLTLTVQLRKQFENGLNTSLAYTYLQAKNNLKSTEIASVLWQNQPVQGDPNNPRISWSEFGNPHRIIGSANYRHVWSTNMGTSVGLFFEMAQGNRYIYSGGNRYSFIYSGDVNGDGYGGNDLIYIPESASDINLDDPDDWDALDAFIKQDDYLSEHRGEISERFGAINPWFSNIDLRVLQDYSMDLGGQRHTVQLSLDIMNAANLLSSNFGVRKVASPAATSPLKLVGWTDGGEPIFDFTGPSETYIDDPGEFSRWRVQLGLRYLF
ncbi:MAG: carboxypeptidase regulatory-like domain-containing protein [Candidatus Neomarinimicrobiota bacterium]